jgi:pimeloyl-ACP methyl ester carboxylesterase
MSCSYTNEMRQARQRVAAVASTTIDTRWGAVVYVHRGEGVPLFLSHGVLGGHDNVRDLVDLWFGPQYRAIGPSRFGYLGSTMLSSATVTDQADAFAALLDHLHLERVVMCGFSAGGPATIRFALRYPDRLAGLILASSYLPGMAKPIPNALHPPIRAIVGWERGWWLLKENRPGLLARIMGVPKGWDPSQDADFLAIRSALFPVRPKKLGIAFDALVSEPASDAFPLEEIRVPTLVVHAADDRLAPYEHVEPAAERIPNSRLVTIEAGGHLVLHHAAEVREATTAFITQVLAGAGSERSDED